MLTIALRNHSKNLNTLKMEAQKPDNNQGVKKKIHKGWFFIGILGIVLSLLGSFLGFLFGILGSYFMSIIGGVLFFLGSFLIFLAVVVTDTQTDKALDKSDKAKRMIHDSYNKTRNEQNLQIRYKENKNNTTHK